MPTIRPETIPQFVEAWQEQIKKYDLELVLVHDGDDPMVYYRGKGYGLDEIMGKEKDLISPKSAAIKNLGLAFLKSREKTLQSEVVIILDDDVFPKGDTIGDHLRALEMKVPVSWMSTTIVKDTRDYMRGFPYAVREEATVMMSHGVWYGIPDRDAPSQLVSGAERPVEFFVGAVPKGVYFPLCGMNIAFKWKAAPYVYFAPVSRFQGAERFDDIWMGINLKRAFDENGWAVVTGYAESVHKRASDVWKSLEREVIGLKLNETYWMGDEEHKFFKDYELKRERWIKLFLS